MKTIASQTMLAILCLMVLGGYNANAVSCGPVQDPCAGKDGLPPGATVSWSCADPETCGTSTCVEYCSHCGNGPGICTANNCDMWIWVASNPCNSPH
jgi:hypothetical protein